MSAAAAPLAADLEAALKRLKLRRLREIAPEVLQAAKLQRWAPEELLRTLVEAEIAARDAANAERRLRAAGFPVEKRLEEFALTQSSVPRATYDYLASLEWVRASENLCLVGPAGTGKSHLLIALGHAAVSAGHRVRYLTAAELIELLYRGLADNSVGKQIAALLRCELVIVDEVGFAPLDATGTQLPASWPAPTNAAAWRSRATGRSRTGGASCPSRRPPSRCSTACCTTPPWWSPRVSPTA